MFTTEETLETPAGNKLLIDIGRDIFEEIDGHNILDKQEINQKIRDSKTPRDNQTNHLRLNDKVQLQNFNGEDCPITINKVKNDGESALANHKAPSRGLTPLEKL